MAATLAACGDSGGEGGEADPQAVIDDATLQGIESANLDLSVDVDASGDEGGNIAVSLSGPFQSSAPGKLPELDMDAKVSGTITSGGSDEDIDFEGGLVLFPNCAFVSYEGTDYEVDPTTFSFVESAVKRAQKEGGAEEESATGCQEALAGVDIGNFVENLSNDGSADVEGTSTTKVSGDLDVGGAISALTEVSEDPACSDQLGAVGELPSGSEVNDAKEEVESAIKSAHADLYVGEDNIIRRISAQITIEPEAKGGKTESVDLAIDLTLGGVNEPQDISAPEQTKPLSNLFVDLGVNPIELLGALEGETEGLENLLESLGSNALSGGGSSGGDESSSGGGSGGGSSAETAEEKSERRYMKCLQGVTSAADLQKCAALK
jgi:hypothetical protein